MTVMVPIPYKECRNFVTVNDCYGPPYLIWDAVNPAPVNDCYGSPYLIWNAGTFYLSMTYGPPYLIQMVGTL